MACDRPQGKSEVEFTANEAFERNFGLVSREEQKTLAGCLVAIAGCGGVGGAHAHTLARLGVGRFRLTDPDTFSVANFNRQIGATVETVGRNKAAVTARMIQAINPEASVEIVEGGLTADNAGEFVRGTNAVVDGVDFFAIEARRRLFAAAWQWGAPALTAAPLGFSGTVHVFARGGMSADEYFDWRDGQEPFDQIVGFLLGLAPSALHLPYMDLSSVDPETGRGPSSIIGCQMAACLLGAQLVRALLNRGGVRLAPEYLQFDAYRQRLRRGRLRRGNRTLLQRLKRRILLKRLRETGWTESRHEPPPFVGVAAEPWAQGERQAAR